MTLKDYLLTQECPSLLPSQLEWGAGGRGKCVSSPETT